MLKIINLTYDIKGKNIFNNLELIVNDNDIIFLLGQNGTGKSTLLNIISNALKVKNIDIINEFDSIFYLSDKFTLIDNLTSLKNLEYFCNYFKSNINPYYLMDELMIENRCVSKLSKGNRQKLALAISLMSSAELLLIDEALDGLDSISVKVFIKLLKSSNKTSIVVTHDNRVYRYKNVRRLLLKEGILIEC